MKLVSVIALPSSLVLGLFFGCSDPPSPPAQAALGIVVLPVSGQCPVPGNPINVPPDPAGQPNAVNTALLCDLTKPDCKPDDYVVVNGDKDATVDCRVTPKGDGTFDISVNLGTTRFNLSAGGTLTATGGTVSMNIFEQTSGRSLEDKGCKLVIPPNQGTVKKGALWARFTCDGLVDRKDSSGATCRASGQFIFENCAS